jgi:hypothetical protein
MSSKVRTLEGYYRHDYLLAGESLYILFQHTFSTGQLSAVWCDAILCAVSEEVVPLMYDNYRGIAVGALMGKLYSMIVEAQLDRFCEDFHGYRVTGQVGFRRKRACSYHVFILERLIGRTSRVDARRNLFVFCFVDFRNACDMV